MKMGAAIIDPNEEITSSGGLDRLKKNGTLGLRRINVVMTNNQ